MRIFKHSSSEKLLWKHHLAEHFKNGSAPIHNNGVGVGGHLFINFEDMVGKIGRDKYWVVPVMMSEEEFDDCGNGMVEAKVNKLGIGDFAPISYWETNQP